MSKCCSQEEEFYGEALLEKIRESLAQVSDSAASGFCTEIERARSVFLTGQGRTGFAARAFAMRLRHCGKTAWVVGETITPPVAREDLLIACSCSGETSCTLGYARKAKEMGARMVALTSKPNSSLAKMSDFSIILYETPGAFLGGTIFEGTLWLFLDAMIHVLQQRWGVTEADLRKRHANLE